MSQMVLGLAPASFTSDDTRPCVTLNVSVAFSPDSSLDYCDLRIVTESAASAVPLAAPSIRVGDTLGCGVRMSVGEVFFTLNGQVISGLSVPLPLHEPLFPCVSAMGSDIIGVRMNCGENRWAHFFLTIGDVTYLI
jgi:hypothetical protein